MGAVKIKKMDTPFASAGDERWFVIFMLTK